MRDLLDKLSSADTRYDFIQSLNESETLNEANHPMAQHFAPLDIALTMFENARLTVNETMHTFMKVEAVKLSKQFRNSYVLLSGGMGTLNIWIYPSADYANQLDIMLDSGDPYEEDRAYEFQAFVKDLNDTHAKPDVRFLPFFVNDKLHKDYGIDSWDLGEVAFHNGQEATPAAVRAHAKTLSSSVQRMSQGG